MPRHKLPDDESERLLARGRLVRIGFQDTAAPYLIPLGYVFLHSALYGVTEPGRKTRVAAVNPSVAFQVDTSSESGLWEWESVTGEGRFEIVTGKAEREDNVLKNAPHTAKAVVSDAWQHSYSREQAAFPLKWVRDNKFWPSVARIDNVRGDKNLICSCPPIESYADA